MREEDELRGSIHLSRFQVKSWFKEQKGDTYRPTPLPYLSDNQKAERVTREREMKKRWVRKRRWFVFLTKSGFIPLDAKEGSITYLRDPINQRALIV